VGQGGLRVKLAPYGLCRGGSLPISANLALNPSCRGEPCVRPHNNTVDTIVHISAQSTLTASSGGHKVRPYNTLTTGLAA